MQKYAAFLTLKLILKVSFMANFLMIVYKIIHHNAIPKPPIKILKALLNVLLLSNFFYFNLHYNFKIF